ncbi:MAG: SPOR domain-containing protein [Rhodospirillaceae bacterium]
MSNVLRNFTLALGLMISACTLSGCAGISALPDLGFLDPRNVFGPGSDPLEEVLPGSQGIPEKDIGLTRFPIEADGTLVTESLTGGMVDDPINAPPPPLSAPSETLLVTPTSRPLIGSPPLMLVPPPGGEPRPVGTLGEQPSGNVTVRIFEANSPENSQDIVSRDFTATGPTAQLQDTSSQGTVIVSSQSLGAAARGREFIPAPISSNGLVSNPLRPGEIPLTKAQENALERFEIFDVLLSEELVTQQEYAQRRKENIGAILPYSNNAPSIGLQRRVPSGEAISSRLAALKRSLEMRAITPRQHAIERSMILDALLPGNPRERATPNPPPADIIAAAAIVGQLERLRFEGVITDREFESERRAIDRYLQSGGFSGETMSETDKSMEVANDVEAGSMSPSMSTGLGVHLASYRSESAAQSGWESLQSKYGSQLGGLLPVIRRVNLGVDRGTFYRLFAGPVADASQANSICQELKSSDQYCDPLRFDT